MVKKYRRLPIVIEAFQYDGDLMNSNGEYYVPEWAQIAHKNGVIYCKDDGDMYIKTLEGDHHASVGDFIIQGIIMGEIYPCKSDVFWKTYEEVT